MSLYPKLLGKEYEKLALLVQEMYNLKEKKILRGVVNIERGKSLHAKILNLLMQLPSTQENALLELELSTENQQEHWKRTFGKDSFSSIQYQSGVYMLEKIGIMKMFFRLYVKEGSLCTVLEKSTFLGLRVPKFLSVNLKSQVKEVDGNISFFVEVCTFREVLVIRYDGLLE